MSGSFEQPILAMLDRWQAAGRMAQFWLRDDDAVAPTAALDRLVAVTARHRVPLTLAVIPEPAGRPLRDMVAGVDHLTVTVHGWTHRNHAPEDRKKAELGADRPIALVEADLVGALSRMQDLFGARLLPVLVPPWNRIDPALIASLACLGFAGLSVYGPEKPAPLPVVNSHVDVMDWHGTRGCRDFDQLGAEIVARLERCLEGEGRCVGLLTHHLVHDAAVWRFLERLFAATAGHPACRWSALAPLLDG